MTLGIRLKPLLISVAIPLVGGFLSSRVSGDMKEVYASLTLPSFAPNGALFGIVWPILYLMIGVAAYLIWETPHGDERTRALTFYAVQLFLNFCWSPLFFGAERFGAAFGLLCVLFLLAIVTTVYFALLDRRTLWLMLPYLAWLLYAAALNRAIMALNG